ncbi:hypothetical protein [Haloplanus pelagicus]|uniref:hypothetical protein n=1 Tax=Haloplanus pelagicus TaxID=2949995 RepID=UPI00203DD717|nr:hypothetical protein [Haloplanus sp. HW8-1]
MANGTQIALSTLQIVGLVLPVTLIGGRFYLDLLENRAAVSGSPTDRKKIADFLKHLSLIASLLIASAALSIAFLILHADLGLILLAALGLMGFAFAYFITILQSMKKEIEPDVM